MYSANAKSGMESFSNRFGMMNFSGLSNLFGSNKKTEGGGHSTGGKALSGFLNG